MSRYIILPDNSFSGVCTYVSHSDGLRCLVRAMSGIDNFIPSKAAGTAEYNDIFWQARREAVIHGDHLSPFLRERLRASFFLKLLAETRESFENYARERPGGEDIEWQRPTLAYKLEPELMDAFGIGSPADFVTWDYVVKALTPSNDVVEMLSAQSPLMGGITPYGNIVGPRLPVPEMLHDILSGNPDSQWFLTHKGWALNLKRTRPTEAVGKHQDDVDDEWAVAGQYSGTHAARLLLDKHLNISTRGRLLAPDLSGHQRLEVPSRYLVIAFANKCLGNTAPPSFPSVVDLNDYLRRIGAEAAMREEESAVWRLD